MSTWIRDAPIGQIIRWATSKKFLKYPEEYDDWVCPNAYRGSEINTPTKTGSVVPQESLEDKSKPVEAVESVEALGKEESREGKELDTPADEDEDGIAAAAAQEKNALEQVPTQNLEHDHHRPQVAPVQSHSGKIHRIGSNLNVGKTITQKDLESQFAESLKTRTVAEPILPQKTADGQILVDWYDTNDSANPQNWPMTKKLFVTLQICLYTFAVYLGSSIVTSSEPDIIRIFGVSSEVASLVLSMYVLGYGLGPMLFSPLSEIPIVGRNPPYIITFAIFVILCIPASLVNDFPGFVVLRFLLGFFGSPCLATGGASMGDIFSLLWIPFPICLWALAATAGPALGPVIGGFSVAAENWHWTSWEILWLSGPIFLTMFCFLPETSHATILYQRAKRIRARKDGSARVLSQSEIDQANLSVTRMILENLYRPFQMIALDPAVAFTALYTALIYGIYYSFFEVFPLVYIDMYHFNLGEMGLNFLSISVGVGLAIAAYWSYLYWSAIPWVRANGYGSPERRLIPALYATWLCPAGLFIFAWSSRPDIHWMVPTIGILIFTIGIFIVLQCIFVFLPFTYPAYAASLFAGNDLTRSALAVGAIHFSSPMFKNIGVGRGVSILGGLTVGCCFGLYALWYYGESLRKKSRFSAK